MVTLLTGHSQIVGQHRLNDSEHNPWPVEIAEQHQYNEEILGESHLLCVWPCLARHPTLQNLDFRQCPEISCQY